VKRTILRRIALIAALLMPLAGCAASGTNDSPAPATSAAIGTTGVTATIVLPAQPPKARHVKPEAGTTTTATTTDAAIPARALTLIAEPDQGLAPIDRFLASARHSLDMTMYELVDATVERILGMNAARGVAVRVILDRNEERAANTSAYDYLAAQGVHVRWATASYDATHEKSAVVDAGESDAKALIMTLNLTSRYYANTRDFAVIDSIPADVAAIETVFNADYSGRRVVPPPGADLVWSPGSQPALISLIDSARATLAVENEEMSSPAIIDALAAAAQRGVDVRITMTADSEWDRAFAKLTAAGVHLHLYPDTATALYIHAKTIVADGHTAFVGSENFSDASLDYNRELGVITDSLPVVARLAALVTGDYAGAVAPASPITSPSTATPVAPAPTAGPSCHPLSDEDGCYEPGEYCRDDDHGTTGVAGNGESITCRQSDGSWEWQAS
jgi:cardiolipin synthase A/B